MEDLSRPVRVGLHCGVEIRPDTTGFESASPGPSGSGSIAAGNILALANDYEASLSRPVRVGLHCGTICDRCATVTT